MRYIVISFCFIVGCQPSGNTRLKSSTSMRASTLFTDSTMYRARCKEADSLVSLMVIPAQCTPRDQRVEIR